MDMKRLIEKTTPYGILGVKISQNGKLVGEHLWEEDCRRNIYSASKSFTSCAVGIAQSEGLLSIDEKLVDAFAGDLPEEVGENLAKATVRDLLTMCLGQAEGFLMGGQRVWMEEETHTQESQWLEDYLLNGGVYGNSENKVVIQQGQTGSRSKYILSRIFMPIEEMQYRYEVLKKHKWLYPFMVIRRCFEVLFKDGKRIKKELKTSEDISNKKQGETMRLVEYLGLK